MAIIIIEVVVVVVVAVIVVNLPPATRTLTFCITYMQNVDSHID